MNAREKLENYNKLLLTMEFNMQRSIDSVKEAIAKSEHLRFLITNTLNNDKTNLLGGE
jgi:hypothetical protein